MPIVYGQIESLKRLRQEFEKRGISRFNSIRDIKQFLKYFDRHKEDLLFKVEQDYNLKYERLLEQKMAIEKDYQIQKAELETRLIQRINKLTTLCEASASVETSNPVVEVLYWYKYIVLKTILFVYKRSYKKVVRFRTQNKLDNLKSLESSVNSFSLNRESFISNRFKTELHELEHIRKVISELNPLIAGAIGENLVAKELNKILTTAVLFHDYSILFDKPIYYKKENQTIRSIQIDHLLVTKAGVFIIETKNWSKKSVMNLDLRSPVSQMQRSGYALYLLLNGKGSKIGGYLNQHHWGAKELPTRNVLVMINNKPNEKFRHIAIKNLDELNDYINFFEPIFDDAEVLGIANYLKRLKN